MLTFSRILYPELSLVKSRQNSYSHSINSRNWLLNLIEVVFNSPSFQFIYLTSFPSIFYFTITATRCNVISKTFFQFILSYSIYQKEEPEKHIILKKFCQVAYQSLCLLIYLLFDSWFSQERGNVRNFCFDQIISLKIFIKLE